MVERGGVTNTFHSLCVNVEIEGKHLPWLFMANAHFSQRLPISKCADLLRRQTQNTIKLQNKTFKYLHKYEVLVE